MKIGMTCYATEQGLGYLAKSFYDAGLISEVILIPHRCRQFHPEWYKDCPHVVLQQYPIHSMPEVRDMLSRLDIMLFFETPFDWDFPHTCRAAGVKTVMMPMHEWFPRDPARRIFDLYLCPSALDVSYFPGNPLWTPPVNPATWRQRTTVRRFLHNAGNAGSNWHKGTLELLKAVPYIRPEIRLTVRCQDCEELAKILNQAPDIRGFPQVEIVDGSIPYSELFSGDHDAYVAPEKYNGLSLPLQEARAAGLLVITTNRYPANTWLPQEPLIPVASTYQSAIGPGYIPFVSSIVHPEAIAETMNAWYGRDITEYSLQGKAWAEENSWAAKKPALMEILERLVGHK